MSLRILIVVGLLLSGAAVAQPFGYITNFADGTVSVIDTATNTVVDTITVGGGPSGVAVSPDGNRVYVGNSVDDSVSIINATTKSVVDTITFPGFSPSGLVVSPDGGRVYVALNHLNGAVAIIDTATNTQVPGIAVGGFPVGVAVSPDGSRVYVANFGDDSVSIADAATKLVVDTVSFPGFSPFGVVVSPDGGRVYVTLNHLNGAVAIIDTATNTQVPGIGVGSFPLGVAVSPDGSRVYVANSGEDSVSIADAATKLVVDTVTFPGFSPFGLAVSPDGGRVYVALNHLNGAVAIIDTATNTQVPGISVGSFPQAFGLFIGPGGAQRGIAIPTLDQAGLLFLILLLSLIAITNLTGILSRRN